MYIKINAPDIPEYPSGFPQYWLKTLFIQSPSDRYQINALTSTYVRLVEAALIEYRSGVDRLREFWDTHSNLNLGAMHRSISHFEACISNMHRATQCFRRLRRDRLRDPLSLKLKEKKPQFITDAVADRCRGIRNEIHHLETTVMDGRITTGQPFALKPDGPEIAHPTEPGQTTKTIDRLVIGTREVRFQELADWLTETAYFAALIGELLPTKRPAERL